MSCWTGQIKVLKEQLAALKEQRATLRAQIKVWSSAFFHCTWIRPSDGQEPASLHCLILELPATRHTTKLVIPWRRCLPTPKPWRSKPSLEQFLTLALGFLHGFAIGLVARRKAYQSLSLKFLQLELSLGAARLHLPRLEPHKFHREYSTYHAWSPTSSTGNTAPTTP